MVGTGVVARPLLYASWGSVNRLLPYQQASGQACCGFVPCAKLSTYPSRSENTTSIFIYKPILLTNVIVDKCILFKKMSVVSLFFFLAFWTELSVLWDI